MARPKSKATGAGWPQQLSPSQAATLLCQLEQTGFSGKSHGRYVVTWKAFRALTGMVQHDVELERQIAGECLRRGYAMLALCDHYAIIPVKPVRRWRPLPLRIVVAIRDTATIESIAAADARLYATTQVDDPDEEDD
jgi:hypothetical protein